MDSLNADVTCAGRQAYQPVFPHNQPTIKMNTKSKTSPTVIESNRSRRALRNMPGNAQIPAAYKMMTISFAKTQKEFLAGVKTETRRDWTDRTLKKWQNAWDSGRHIHQASNKLLYSGGVVIGRFELTACPTREPLNTMTSESLVAEGGMCKTLAEYCALIGQSPEKVMTVVRFRKL